MSDQMNPEFRKSFLELQKKIKNPTKDGTNPVFGSDYATLESVLAVVKEPCLELGFIITHALSDDGKHLKTYLIHEHGVINTAFPIINAATMQSMGSAITYARRYTLVNIFGLVQVDDDGNEASGTKLPQSNQSQSPRPMNPIAQKSVPGPVKPNIVPKLPVAKVTLREPAKASGTGTLPTVAIDASQSSPPQDNDIPLFDDYGPIP